jgi:hypothetical protein
MNSTPADLRAKRVLLSQLYTRDAGLIISATSQTQPFPASRGKKRVADQRLDGGSIEDVAVGIVLDLLTMLHRGEGLAEIANAA